MKKFVFSFLAFSVLVASAQKTPGKLSFTPGQTIEITTNMNMTTQSMMGEMPATIVTVDQYTVGDVKADGIQLTKTPKKMKAAFSMMGQEMNLDSDNPQDLEGQFGAPIKELMKQKQEFTVDASGKIVAVKTEAKKVAGDAGMMGMMMPGMAGGDGTPAVGNGSIFKILPAREVAKGDTWTDSVSVAGNKSVTVYTVKDILDNDVVLQFTGHGASSTTQSVMGTSVDVATTSKNEGTVTIDRATGLLKQKTMTANTDSAMNMGGNEMKTTTKMTVVMTVKTL